MSKWFHSGVVLLRLMGLASKVQAELVAETVRMYEAQMEGGTVISPKIVRVRLRSLS